MSKNPTFLERKLTEVGFTPDEGAVYLTALSLGSCSVLQLSRSSGLKRTTLYGVLERLTQRGIGTWEITASGKKFSAVPPDRLLALVRERAEMVQNLVPDLLALYRGAPSGWHVRLVEGRAGIRTLYDELLVSVKPGDTYFALSDLERWEGLDRTFFKSFVERRERLGLNPRVLAVRSRKAEERQRLDPSRVRILPAGVRIDTNLVIVPDRVLMHQLSAPNIAVVLASPAIVAMHSNLFELLWQLGQGRDKSAGRL